MGTTTNRRAAMAEHREHRDHPMELVDRNPWSDSDPVALDATSESSARAEAHELLADWYATDIESTIWCDFELVADGIEGGRETAAFDPPEPACTADDGHDWDGPTVSGNGGGVIMTESCPTCGLRRVTDTWAQRPDTGEQGLRSISYDA
jgi:hypothetical protein